jgi:hypothetical protein
VIDNQNIELLVNTILAGKKIFSYDDKKYEIKKPSLELRIQSDILYSDTYNNNIFNDFILLEDIPNLCISLGIIPHNYTQQILDLEKKLENIKLEYFSLFADIDKRKRNKTKLNNFKKQYTNFLETVHMLDYISLEHYCSKVKNEFIILNTLYFYETNILVFKNQKDTDYIYFNNLINEINKNTLDIDVFKTICRSEYWRNLWSDNKHFLISEPISEWSEEQKTLCSLSKMYDRIYEHPECPSDEIIEDNDALDGWMIHQKRENSKQKQEKGVNNMLSDKIKNSSEIFLMANNQEKAQKIMEFNDQQSLGKMNQKLNFVKSHSQPVKDSQLPDVKQDLVKQFRQQQGK